MQIFEKKPKPKYKSSYESKEICDNEEVVETKNENIESVEEKIEQKKDVITDHIKETILKNEKGTSISSKTKQMLGKVTSYAGIFSIINSTGNACKGIASNPFLLVLGIGLLAASVGMFLWSLFK